MVQSYSHHAGSGSTWKVLLKGEKRENREKEGGSKKKRGKEREREMERKAEV